MEMAEVLYEQLKSGILVSEALQQLLMYAQLFEGMAFSLHLLTLETMGTLFSMMGVAIYVSLRVDTIVLTIFLTTLLPLEPKHEAMR
jgi:hypothetical protein